MCSVAQGLRITDKTLTKALKYWAQAILKLIEDDTAKLVRRAKDFRNLIHPERAARLRQRCDRSTALTALAAVEAVRVI
jgi:hypothetical protein